MLVYLKNENYKDLVKDDIVIVDFYADWCGPCKMLGQSLESLQDKYKIVKVNVDEHEDLAKEFGIMSIPTVIIYKDGKIKKQMVGFMPSDALEEEINRI